ncbi:MAG: thioredoxin family protein, partial [Pseudomonadota bacterium]
TPDGTQHAMRDHLTEKGLLIAFICNHCPYVVAVAERLAADAKALQADGIGVLAVMSNDYYDVPADSPANMTRFAEQYGFTFPYLVDEGQMVGRRYGAVCTPDFFGFNGAGELQYRGRLDSAGMGDPTGRVPELLDAMAMISELGQGPREQTPSMGCSIKWTRE